jgi:hypothetical protein
MARRRSATGPEIVARAGDLLVQRDAGRPTGRLLRQGDMDASYVDLADARHLEFDYLRWIAAAIEALRAGRIVHVGGAACALARALAAADPDRRQQVVEVDPDVLALSRAHLGLRRMPGLKVRCADGRRFIEARPDGSADAIVVDAFVGARVPRHLATAEALADAARVVALGGALMINVVDVPPLRDVRAIGAGLRAAFTTVAALGPGPVVGGRRAGNVVLLAGHGPLPLQRLRPQLSADPSPAALLDGDGLAALLGGAAPWRDDQG